MENKSFSSRKPRIEYNEEIMNFLCYILCDESGDADESNDEILCEGSVLMDHECDKAKNLRKHLEGQS